MSSEEMKERSREMLTRVFQDGIAPHAESIVPIIERGRIACVVFELGKETAEIARDLGWDGLSPVFQMGEVARRRMARAIAAHCPDDRASVRWLKSKRRGRIFLLVHGGSLLVNFDPDEGFSLEPGSTDLEWMN